MTYNLTNLVNETSGFSSFISSVNTQLMGGWFGVAFLMGLGLVLFSSFMFTTNDIKRSMLSTSVLIFGFSFFFRILGLVSDKVLFLTLIGCAIIVAGTWRSD